MQKQILELQAARYAFGCLNTLEMQEFIDSLLNDGIYFREFIDVVEPEADTFEIVGAAFEKALNVLGVTIPNYENAVWLILHYHISRIAKNESDPVKSLKAMIDEIMAYDFHAKYDKYLGDSHGIEYLFGLHWGWDDIIGLRTKNASIISYDPENNDVLKKEIVSEAKKWLEYYNIKPT